MKKKGFKILFEGQIQPDFDESEVRESLSKLFKADETRMNRLFSGKPYALRKDISEKEARKYEQAILKAGGSCRIVSMDGEQELTSSAPKEITLSADEPMVAKTQASTPKEPFRILRRMGRARYLALCWLVPLIEVTAFMLPDYLPMLIGGALTIQQTVSMVAGIHTLAGLIAIYLMITRLHDMDRNGWLWLFALIPIVNLLFLLWLGIGRGTKGWNVYGNVPPAPANLTMAIGVYLPLCLLLTGIAGAWLNQDLLIAAIQDIPDWASEWAGLEYPG